LELESLQRAFFLKARNCAEELMFSETLAGGFDRFIFAFTPTLPRLSKVVPSSGASGDPRGERSTSFFHDSIPPFVNIANNCIARTGRLDARSHLSTADSIHRLMFNSETGLYFMRASPGLTPAVAVAERESPKNFQQS